MPEGNAVCEECSGQSGAHSNDCKQRGWCDRCGNPWCDQHDCCALECPKVHLRLRP
jgi:hypothetical protein